MTGNFYISKSQLNSMELMHIANEAKSVSYMDGSVNWLNAALKMAKKEKQDSKYIGKIK